MKAAAALMCGCILFASGGPASAQQVFQGFGMPQQQPGPAPRPPQAPTSTPNRPQSSPSREGRAPATAEPERAIAKPQPHPPAPVSQPILSGFACPKTGTRTSLLLDNGTVAREVWKGTDPGDPMTCLVEGQNGRTAGRFLGYWTDGAEWVPESKAAARAALDAVISGSPATAEYELRLQKPSTVLNLPGATNRLQHTVRGGQRTTLQIKGKATETIRFDVVSEGKWGNIFMATRTFWYDPVSRLYVRVRIQLERGISRANSFELVDMTVPD